MISSIEHSFNEELQRAEPIFDVSVKAHKASPFSRISQNELAKELFGIGAFNPEMAHMVLPMLDMMDFEGKDALIAKITETAQQYNAFIKFQQMLMQQQQMAQMMPQQNPQPQRYEQASMSPADKARERVLNSATPKA